MKKRILSMVMAFTMIISVMASPRGGLTIKSSAAAPAARPLPVLTGNQRADVANIALSQVGYRESSTGENIYNDWYYGYAGNIDPYCAVFVSWCANKAGVPTNVINKNAGAGGFTAAPKTNSPERGDIVEIKYANDNYTVSHVGIFIEDVGSQVRVVSGNWTPTFATSYGGDWGVHETLVNKSGGYEYVVGYRKPNYTTSGNNPMGYVDSITGGEGSVSIRGWAFDRDDTSKHLKIHVYIGGPAGSAGASSYDAGKTGVSRKDVSNAYPGVGDNHGFETVINTSKRGSQPVYIYAINIGGGSANQLLGSGTVNITDPSASSVNIPNGIYTIKGKTSGKPVTVDSGLKSDGAVTYIIDNNNWDYQQFNFERQSDNTYKITAVHSGKALSVKGSSSSDDAVVEQRTWNGGDNQRWYIYKTSDGYYNIVAKHSGKYMNIYANNTANFTKIVQWEKDNSDEQKFSLSEASANCTVTFNTNGGGSAPEEQTVASGLKAAKPADPKRKGYTFDGWYQESACINEWDFSSDKVTADITLYAKWSVMTQVDTPTASSKNEVSTSGQRITLSCTTEGAAIYYTTDGSVPTTSSKRYTAPFKISKTTLINAIAVKKGMEDSEQLTVEFTPKSTFTVTFDSRGGSYVEEITDISANSTILAPDEPTRNKYTFDGWYEEQDCINKWNFSTDKVTKDIKLYAKWKKSSSSSKTTKKQSDGTTVTTVIETKSDGSEVKTETAKRKGSNNQIVITTTTKDKKTTVTANISVKDVKATIKSSTGLSKIRLDISKDTAKAKALLGSKKADIKVTLDDAALLKRVNNSKVKSLSIYVTGGSSANVKSLTISKKVINKASTLKKKINVYVLNTSGKQVAKMTVTANGKNNNFTLDATATVGYASKNSTVASAIKSTKNSNGIVLNIGSSASNSTSKQISVKSYLNKTSGVSAGKTVYVYKLDSKSGKLKYVSSKKISSSGTITFKNGESGTIVLLAKKI